MAELLYEIRGPKTLMEMTWPEVESLSKETDIALMSIGACEQHGHHLPLGTDTIQSTETLKYAHGILLKEYGVKCLIAPTIPWGINPGAMCYPGSLTVSTRTLIALLEELCEGLYNHGFKKIVLFLGHDENYGSMMVAAQNLVTKYSDIKVVVLNPMPALKASERASLDLTAKKRPDAHAGAGETSRALCLYPNLTYIDRAQDDGWVYSGEDVCETIIGGEPPLMGGGVYNPADEGRGFSRERGDAGQTGDPALADAEAGRKAYAAMGRVIAQVVCKLFVTVGK